MNELTAFQRDCLRAVSALEEPCGLDVKEWLENDRGDEIHHGRLYPNLDTLVTKGLVHKRPRNRRSNIYTLSSRGEREVEMFHNAWGDAVSNIDANPETGRGTVEADD